jgi:hypothetical protein
MWKGNSAAVIRVVPYLSLQVSLPGWLGVAGSTCAGCAATGWIGWVRLCSVSNADRPRAVGQGVTRTAGLNALCCKV